MYYLKYFFFSSILGFFMEVIINGDSGILYGPYTPVYGIGCLIILFIFQKNKRRGINTKSKYVITVVSSFLLLTLIELIGGLIIEKFFGFSFWNYTNKRFNIGKYICLEMSFVWLLVSILFLFFKPIIDKIINRIPSIVVCLLSIVFIFDIFITVISRGNVYEKNNFVNIDSDVSGVFIR